MSEQQTKAGYAVDFDMKGYSEREAGLRGYLPDPVAVANALASVRAWILEAMRGACADADHKPELFQDKGDGYHLLLPTAESAHRVAIGLTRRAHAVSAESPTYFRIGIARAVYVLKPEPSFTADNSTAAARLQAQCDYGGVLICPLTWAELPEGIRTEYEKQQIQFEAKGQRFQGHRWRRPPDLATLAPPSPDTRGSVAIRLNFLETPVERTKLFDKFLSYVLERNVIFALGGVGGGLKSFLHHFHIYLENSGSHNFKAVDFNLRDYKAILEIRKAHIHVSKPYGSVSEDKLELKCLLASLAYQVCHTLAGRFPEAMHGVIDKSLTTDVPNFQEHFFAFPAMKQTDPRPIIEHFFALLHQAASAVPDDRVLVFMPLQALAECFRNVQRDKNTGLWELAWALWNALSVTGSMAKYGKVSLIVGARELPYGHSPSNISLVRKCLWCMPPLGFEETEEMLKKVSPTLSSTDTAALLLRETAGSPWITRLVLSFTPVILSRIQPVDGVSANATEVIQQSIELTEREIASGGAGVEGPLKTEIEERLKEIEGALGGLSSDDSVAISAWMSRDRNVGYVIQSPRIESLVASGLIWLDGDPWNESAPDHVFADYPFVRFRSPSRIAVAAYRHITEIQIETRKLA